MREELCMTTITLIPLINREIYDGANEERITETSGKGITEAVVRQISLSKSEPEWMLKKRLEALELFNKMQMPDWGPDLKKLDLNEITYFAISDSAANTKSWDDVPADIKNTFERLGIPEAERKVLAGVGAQYESQVVYHSLKEEWAKKGVIFEDMDVAVQKYPKLVQEYFMKCVPSSLHKFAALHAAVWSGGTFLYIPKNVTVDIPLQAYFRMNAKSMGQFEHTLIIVDEGAQVHYIEGCSAPLHSKNSLHAGCVEVFVKKNARARYSSVENWSKNTYNLNTKRAIVDEHGIVEWVGGNLGSGCTMLYPCSILRGEYSKAEHIGIALAAKGQNQDVGAKVYHVAPYTTSIISSKSISLDGGITTYRGLVKISKSAHHSKSNVNCDALMTDNRSASNTIPYMEVSAKDCDIAHEATCGKLSEENLFYLMSRGLSKEKAMQMLVSGFIEPVVKELPIEYAVELNKLIEMEMEGSLG